MNITLRCIFYIRINNRMRCINMNNFLKDVLKRSLGLNFLKRSLNTNKTKPLLYFTSQMMLMLAILIFGVLVTTYAEVLIFAHMPINKFSISLSVISIIILYILFLVLPFFISYHFNKHMDKKFN